MLHPRWAPPGLPPRHPVVDLVLMIGECDTPREDTRMLWFPGP